MAGGGRRSPPPLGGGGSGGARGGGSRGRLAVSSGDQGLSKSAEDDRLPEKALIEKAEANIRDIAAQAAKDPVLARELQARMALWKQRLDGDVGKDSTKAQVGVSVEVRPSETDGNAVSSRIRRGCATMMVEGNAEVIGNGTSVEEAMSEDSDDSASEMEEAEEEAELRSSSPLEDTAMVSPMPTKNHPAHFLRSPIQTRGKSAAKAKVHILNGCTVNSDGEEISDGEDEGNGLVQAPGLVVNGKVSVPQLCSVPLKPTDKATVASDAAGSRAVFNPRLADGCCGNHMDVEVDASADDTGLKTASSQPPVAGTSQVPPPLSDNVDSANCAPSARSNVPKKPLFGSLKFLAGLQSPSTMEFASGSVHGLPKPAVVANSVRSMANLQSNAQHHNAWVKPAHVPITKRENRKDFIAPNGVIHLNLGSAQTNANKLENAIVGKLLGRHLPFDTLKIELSKKWAHLGLFKLTTVSNDYFVCVFENSEARDAVLTGGPWFVAGAIIGLDRWTKDFSSDSMDGFMAPVWVRFPQLPLLYWDSINITRIAEGIGDPLWLDAHTDSWERNAYARVCVRIDLSKKLEAGAWLLGINGEFYQKFEYEGISHLCFKCGMVGHKAPLCRKFPVDPLASATQLHSAAPCSATHQVVPENLVQPRACSGASNGSDVNTDRGLTEEQLIQPIINPRESLEASVVLIQGPSNSASDDPCCGNLENSVSRQYGSVGGRFEQEVGPLQGASGPVKRAVSKARHQVDPPLEVTPSFPEKSKVGVWNIVARKKKPKAIAKSGSYAANKGARDPLVDITNKNTIFKGVKSDRKGPVQNHQAPIFGHGNISSESNQSLIRKRKKSKPSLSVGGDASSLVDL